MRRFTVLLLTVLLVLAVPAVALAAYTDANSPAPTTPYAQPFTAPLTDGDTEDNYQGNANRTGGDTNNVDIQDTTSTIASPDVQNIIKSKNMYMNDDSGPRTQRTHGEYQNNTNSCASCHQTHTGAAKDLLFKGSSSANGVYNTCTACHDGTLGFYNVFTPSTAGTFGGTDQGNASVHLATGMANIYMAPGADAQSTNQIWNDEFDCAACHAPHGSYSDRLLHYSPAGMANVPVADGGNKVVGVTVVDSATVPAADGTSEDYILWRTTAGAAGIDAATEPADTNVIVLMKKVETTTAQYEYQRETTPWVAGYEHAMGDNYNVLEMLYYTRFSDGANDITNNLEVIYGLAYAKGEHIASVVTGDIARAYVVDLGDMEDLDGDGTAETDMEQIVLGYFGEVPITTINTDIYDEKGHGKSISKYCGACHSLYMTHSKDADGDGVFRHSTDTDRFNCLKCHFAHGTDVTVMKDANDNTVADLQAAGITNASAYMVDKNASSALKRYTNMSVCWKCHSGVTGKSSKLMNNTYYWDNYDTNPKGGVNTSEHNWTNNNWE